MYIYFISFILVFITALLSLKYKIPTVFFYFEFSLLSFLLLFRYGQGSDYFSYRYIFSFFGSFKDAISNEHGIHSELLFRLICSVFNSFELFVIVVSLYEIVMMVVFFTNHTTNRFLALLFFYHTIYLTYFFSAMRQGIILSTFLGVGIYLMERKKWKPFIAMCLILSLIHSVAIVWLLIPIAYRFDLDLMVYRLLPCSFLLGLLSSTSFFRSFLSNLPFVGNYIRQYLQVGISYFSLLERLLSLILILILYYSQTEYNVFESVLIKVYVYGCILFFVLLPYSLLSARIIICFKIIELILLPQFLSRKSKYRQIIMIYFVLMPVLLYFHNVNGYISQGHYYSSINPINYPYVSIFNENAIWNYRYDNYYYSLTN